MDSQASLIFSQIKVFRMKGSHHFGPLFNALIFKKFSQSRPQSHIFPVIVSCPQE